jgi:hypothetical protein
VNCYEDLNPFGYKYPRSPLPFNGGTNISILLAQRNTGNFIWSLNKKVFLHKIGNTQWDEEIPRIELVAVSEDAPEEIRELMKKIHLFQCGKAELTKEEWDKWWNFIASKNSRSVAS